MLDIFRTLPGLLEGLEEASEARETLVFAAWGKIAGEMLAEHAVACRLEGTRFFVAVSGRTWQKHLEELRPQMIFKINSVLGASLVRSIEFTIDEKQVKAERARRRKEKEKAAAAAREAEGEITPELLAAASQIDDEALRQAFLQAAAGCISRKRRMSETPAG